jgi:hypothetical protein
MTVSGFGVSLFGVSAAAASLLPAAAVAAAGAASLLVAAAAAAGVTVTVGDGSCSGICYMQGSQ